MKIRFLLIAALFTGGCGGVGLCGFVSAVDFSASKAGGPSGQQYRALPSVVLPHFQEIQPNNSYQVVDVSQPGATTKAGRAYFVFSAGDVMLTY